MIDFSKYDKQVDLEGLKNDVETALDGEFKDVPFGEYEVKVDKLELGMSKKGIPMAKVWYTILDGEFKGNKIFHNQLVDTGQKIGIFKRHLESLGTKLDIKFESYSQYAELLTEIKEYIDENKLEYAISYYENDKGFTTYEILEVFEG